MKKGYKSTCRYNLAKDCFILSFCLMGINSADLYNATEMRGNTIIYNRTKTKARRLDGAKMMVDIPKIVQPLIDKYKDSTGNVCSTSINIMGMKRHLTRLSILD